jgi:hypothetical protein
VLIARVANRWLDAGSKLVCCEWVGQDVVLPGLSKFGPLQPYWAIDVLLDSAEAVQPRIFFSGPRSCSWRWMWSSLTPPPRYFEMEGEDEVEDGIRGFDYSRDGGPDRAQVAVGLAVSKEEIPARCWVFPGNTADACMVEQVKETCTGGGWTGWCSWRTEA